jgi:hypothetical protein
MACYISSRENRFFVKQEAELGQAIEAAPSDRINAVRLEIREQNEVPQRRDKTGGRTFAGIPNNVKRKVQFGLETYLTSWDQPAAPPPVGTLWASTLGAEVQLSGANGVSGVTGVSVGFTGPHNLEVGQAVSVDGEMRFVTTIVDGTNVEVNAPFSSNTGLSNPTATYKPATTLKSFTLWDYWSPDTAVQRAIAGGVSDEARVLVNGDWHAFQFTGPAVKLIDSYTFESGTAGLASYPMEPDTSGQTYSVVPGHLGQVWVGAGGGNSTELLTLAEAKLTIKNGVEFGNQYFGAENPRCLSADTRAVEIEFEVFATDDAGSSALYQAARQRSPISLMVQLGEETGRLFGFFLPSVMLDTPEFDDSETRLRWKFKGRAQGTYNDEVYVAFA